MFRYSIFLVIFSFIFIGLNTSLLGQELDNEGNSIIEEYDPLDDELESTEDDYDEEDQLNNEIEDEYEDDDYDDESDVEETVGDEEIDDSNEEEDGSEQRVVARKLKMDAIIFVDYAINDTDVKIKYAISLESRFTPEAKSARGVASIATDVSGYLAKWPNGECTLTIQIQRVPYNIIITETGESELELDLSFSKSIEEDWKSKCRFHDDPDTSFNTSTGIPEIVASTALDKASPGLNSLTATISDEEPTTTQFTINKYDIDEEGIGKSSVEGTGILTLEPIIKGASPEAP
jgi:hypothetical protein